MKQLTLDHVELVAHKLAKVLMTWNEPIPDFSTRNPGILESCLKTPFSTWGKKDFYPTLEEKAGVLFYLMIKNHPFQNGNKRIAVTSLLIFLSLNGKWLTLPEDDLYDLAVWVAGSKSHAKNGVIQAIKDTISNFTT
jgi:death-on-curing family protein